MQRHNGYTAKSGGGGSGQKGGMVSNDVIAFVNYRGA